MNRRGLNRRGLNRRGLDGRGLDGRDLDGRDLTGRDLAHRWSYRRGRSPRSVGRLHWWLLSWGGRCLRRLLSKLLSWSQRSCDSLGRKRPGGFQDNGDGKRTRENWRLLTRGGAAVPECPGQ